MRLAVRASQVDQALEILQKNDQFLPFSKLVIVMNVTMKQTLSLPSTPARLDLTWPKVRPEPRAFTRNFPLKLVGFVHLDSEKASTKPKGFVTVQNAAGGQFHARKRLWAEL